MRWKDWDINLKVRLIGEGIFNILFWMYFPFMAIYFSEHFGQETAGFLLIASQILSVVVGLFGGYCADHFGRKKMMVLSSIGEALCFVFFAYSNSPWLTSPILTFVSFSFLGLFGQLYWPASHAMIADVVPEKHRTSVFAVFYTTVNIAVVIGPILGGIFFFDYRFPFLCACLIVSIILIFVLNKYIHDTTPKKTLIAKGKSEDRSLKSVLKHHLKDYTIIFKDKVFLLFILAGILVAQTFMQLDLLVAIHTTTFVPKQTLLSIGDWLVSIDGKGAFSLLVSINGLCVALLTMLVTKWMMKYQESFVFMASSFCYGVSIILFGYTVNVWLLFLAVMIFSWAELMTVGVQDSFISRLAPEHMRGQYFAAASLRFSIGRTIAPIAIPMTVWFGYTYTFIILGILAFLSAGIYAFMFSLYNKVQRVSQ
ncbi:MDR family MFS transporter [Terrilactibacillus laevilacticus]|uniref:MDR family MFS transporter n=1 Tax=Terrilactibacillus laevilacticus TaxID=1380157 RepID=UPI0011474BC5|nr:MFS transporter [Terrilactibacillus laevilacticus]